MFILRLLLDAQSIAAVSKLNWSNSGPSEERRMNLSTVSVLSLFLGSVLILFIVENPLSQSAVETGTIKAMLANLDKVGYREEKVVLADSVDIISRVYT